VLYVHVSVKRSDEAFLIVMGMYTQIRSLHLNCAYSCALRAPSKWHATATYQQPISRDVAICPFEKKASDSC